MTISKEKRAAIIEALKENPNIKVVARQMGYSSTTIWKIAQQESLNLGVRHNEIYYALMSINGKFRYKNLARLLGMSSLNLQRLVVQPELCSRQWVETKVMPQLLATFPDKKDEIEKFITFYHDQPESAASLKRKTSAEKIADFCLAAGHLLREMREACHLSVEDVQKDMKGFAKRNIGRMEAGDPKLALSIYREGITEICDICGRKAPVAAAPYIPQLENIHHQLKK